VLLFELKKGTGGRRQTPFTGPSAIHRYLEEAHGRLIQSIKSFAASRLFKDTQLGHHRYTFEDLVALLISGLRAECEIETGPLGRRAVVGRPVRFAGTESAADEEFALQRIRSAFEQAGFDQIEFELEPVGAAYAYEQTLARDQNILIADFGGGTSDFSILRVGPTLRRHAHGRRDVLASGGVPLAGEAFDAKIVRHLVSPLLGLGSSYTSLHKMLPVPSSVFLKLERWHHLSFLKSRDTMQMLRSLRATALEPEKIEALIELVEQDLGFQLHRAVQRTKFELSTAPVSTFRFEDSSLHIEQPVTREQFEDWISEELNQMAACVDATLRAAALRLDQIDRVFMTGGTSLVPAVRSIFTSRFGPDRVSAGDEFTSVARGLALRAAELN
jgi:hypothetical chaperone protein